MKIKNKILFYFAAFNRAYAYVRLLTVVGKIQKVSDVVGVGNRVCFTDYPHMQHRCDMAKESSCACTYGPSCFLNGLNKSFVDAGKRCDNAERSYKQAHTQLFCALVPDSQQK